MSAIRTNIFLTVFRLFFCATLLLIGQGILCQAHTYEEQETTMLKRWQILDSVSLGDTEADVTKKLERGFVPSTTNSFFGKYPFTMLLPYTNKVVISEWRAKDVNPDEMPELVFAVFSSAEKTNLIDALWYKSDNIRPLVDGVYNQNLHAIKRGDSIEEVYTKVGKDNCEYFRGTDGKWRVRFVYWGHEGRMIVIEVDAAEGIVTNAADGTI